MLKGYSQAYNFQHLKLYSKVLSAELSQHIDALEEATQRNLVELASTIKLLKLPSVVLLRLFQNSLHTSTKVLTGAGASIINIARASFFSYPLPYLVLERFVGIRINVSVEH